MGSHEKPAGLILITVDGGSQHRCRGRVGSAVGHAQGGIHRVSCSTGRCYPDVVFQSLSRVRLFVTPWTAARQASLSFTISWSFAQTHAHWVDEAIQPSHPHPFFLLPSIFPNIRVFSSESVLRIRWPKALKLQLQSFQ